MTTSSYNLINARKCLQAFSGKPKRILIVGCGSHCEDVKCFNELLNCNVEIVGVDILSKIGVHYSPANATYIRCDIASLPIVSSNFDIAYSFATFEHVHSIKEGWQNMVNVLRPGGLMWSVSSPLWMSPYGHHKAGMFQGMPWIHLYYPDPELLINYCMKKNIKSNDSTEIQHHIRYMLNQQYFNKYSPLFYAESAAAIVGISSLSSYFDSLEIGSLDGHHRLLDLGYSADELLAVTHYLTGFKD